MAKKSLSIPSSPGLAPYAAQPAQSRGRLHAEPESKTRTAFQRDRDRIIHSVAFRRLEYKTQVFVNHEGDHYRTRLTHSLEVSQMARSMARALSLSEDLAEAVALAHDLGHTPFGHAGEDALREVMRPFGGFDHNAQTIKILTSLERRYAEFDGLNLTWETLEGIAKHNGPLVRGKKNPKPAARGARLPAAIAAYNKQHDLWLHSYPSAEAQVASLADDIAYNNHDIDDGLRAQLFSIDDLLTLPLVGDAFRSVTRRYPGIDETRLVHESIRRVIDAMVQDLLGESRARLARYTIATADDVRKAGMPVIAFSQDMQAIHAQLRDFLMTRMYRHYKVNRMTSKARRMVKELFQFFLHEPECLPTQWRSLAGVPGSAKTAGIVCDFIAGMTDRFATLEHKRVFNMME